MLRPLFFALLFSLASGVEAQSSARQSGGTNGLCGNYDEDDCRIINDDIFPGGTIDLFLQMSSPGQVTFALRRLADGQPLVEYARRLNCGTQTVTITVPGTANPETYVLEVRSRSFGMSVVVVIIEP